MTEIAIDFQTIEKEIFGNTLVIYMIFECKSLIKMLRLLKKVFSLQFMAIRLQKYFKSVFDFHIFKALNFIECSISLF